MVDVLIGMGIQTIITGGLMYLGWIEVSIGQQFTVSSILFLTAFIISIINK